MYALLKINWRTKDIRVLMIGTFDEVQYELEVQDTKRKKWSGGYTLTYRRVG